MSDFIFSIVFNFQSICMLLSFILSLRLIKRNYVPKYMEGFYWYPLVGMIVLIPVFIDTNITKRFYYVKNIVINTSIIFHYIFLSLFIIKLIVNKSNYKVLIIIFTVLLLLLVTSLFDNFFERVSIISYIIANFGLIVFCLLYYYRLFNDLPNINLIKEPSFWIITGVFFTMSVHIPILASMSVLKNKISSSNYYILAGVITFCYSIMYLFFCKAILCIIPQKRAL